MSDTATAERTPERLQEVVGALRAAIGGEQAFGEDTDFVLTVTALVTSSRKIEDQVLEYAKTHDLSLVMSLADVIEATEEKLENIARLIVLGIVTKGVPDDDPDKAELVAAIEANDKDTADRILSGRCWGRLGQRG